MKQSIVERKKSKDKSLISLLSLSMCGLLSLSVSGLMSCNIISPDNDPITYGESYIPNLLSTDKAAYKPGETVTLSLNSMPEQAVQVRYTHLGETLSQTAVISQSWTWQPPA